MFNELKSLLPDAVYILQLELALFFIVASTLVCITIAKRTGRDLSALGRKLWGVIKPLLEMAWGYVCQKYQFWQLCRVWRKAMIQYSHSRSRGVVWEFHKSGDVDRLLLATGQTDLGKYIIQVGRRISDGAGGFYVFAYVRFEPEGRAKDELAKEPFCIDGMGENMKCQVMPWEHEQQGGRWIDYFVSKLIPPTIEAIILAEDHAEELHTRFPVPIKSASGWEWELSTTPISGRGQLQTFTSGGYDCFYEVESMITEPKTDVFNVYVSLCLAVEGNNRREIATRNEMVRAGEHAARCLCAELEEEMKVLARERNDDDLDSEFDDAIEGAPTPLEHLAKATMDADESVKTTGGEIPSLDPPVLTASSLVSVAGLSDRYNLSIQEVRQRLIAANKQIDDDNTKGVGFFKDVIALFEKGDPTIHRVNIKGFVSAEESDTDLITIEFLSGHYGLPVEEVRQKLTDDGVEMTEENDRLIASVGRVKHLFEKAERDWVSFDELTAEFGMNKISTIPTFGILQKAGYDGSGSWLSREDTRRLLAEVEQSPNAANAFALSAHFGVSVNDILNAVKGLLPNVSLKNGADHDQLWDVARVEQLLKAESSVEPVDGDMREAGSLSMTANGDGSLGDFKADKEKLMVESELLAFFGVSKETLDVALRCHIPNLEHLDERGMKKIGLWSPDRVAGLLKYILGDNLPGGASLPMGAVKLNLTHDSLCSRHTLGQVFDLTIEEVKEQLVNATPTNGDQQPTLYRLGDVLHMFGWMVVSETGVAPQSLPEGYVPVSMTAAELAVHFNVPISLINEVLDGVEADSVVETNNTYGHDLTPDNKWNTHVVEQLLANREKTNDSTK